MPNVQWKSTKYQLKWGTLTPINPFVNFKFIIRPIIPFVLYKTIESGEADGRKNLEIHVQTI